MPHSDKGEYNAYLNNYMKNRWTKRRAEAISYLGGKCVNCSTAESLEFDHIDPDTKLAAIAKASSWSKERFWTEVDKCQLLCTKCHIAKSKVDGSIDNDTSEYYCCDRRFIGRKSFAGHKRWCQ